MVKRLTTTDAGFENAFCALLSGKLENDPAVNETVALILTDIQTRGDDALLEYTNRFDRMALTDASQLRVSIEAVEAAYNECSSDQLQALQLAAERITVYHKKQLPADFTYTDAAGVTLGNRWVPIEAAGLYVPGGLASYPSSVLMNAIPAKVAGVKRLVMAVPTPGGTLNPLVMAAAKIAGVEEIYTIGGAQAVAALAYGTRTIKAVDKIVGPGNAYVAAAKRQVFGQVGIDMIAGPSEILVIADAHNNPEWVAADLLSQAEHDTAARSILITDDMAFAEAVANAVEILLPTLAREEIARPSWEQNGAIVIVRDWQEAVTLANRIAAEHLELMVENPESLAEKIHHAGAIFIGKYTPEAIGDYTAGPSHVLPTAGTARFSSGLSVFDFIKRISMINCSAPGFAALSDATACLAEAEGLGAHRLSVIVRK